MQSESERLQRSPAEMIGRLQGALRSVQDSVIGTMAPADVAAKAADALEAAAEALAPYTLSAMPAGEWGDSERISDTQTFPPRFDYEHYGFDSLTVGLTVLAHYTGANGVIHGGAIATIFDQGLGRLANHGRPRGRTAYLNVEYRSVTRVNRPLVLESRIEQVERRKRFVSGQLRDGTTVTAEARGLWVELLPGQP